MPQTNHARRALCAALVLVSAATTRSLAAQAAADTAVAGSDTTAPPPILITRVRSTRPDFLGGVDVDIDWTNQSARVVKYARFFITAYNAVGDSVRDEIRMGFVRRLNDTGPYRAGARVNNGIWEGAFYNSSTRCVRIVSAEVEYMDGGTVRIEGAEMARALAPAVRPCPRPTGRGFKEFVAQHVAADSLAVPGS